KDRLVAATGRPLNRQETAFLNRVHQVYLRCRRDRRINYWDFQELGLPIFGDWNALQIWPAVPASEYEFWLYIVNALQERNLRVPDVMQPISDLAPIQDKLARWRREQEIED